MSKLFTRFFKKKRGASLHPRLHNLKNTPIEKLFIFYS